jgi:hypothetical protein
MSDFEGLFALFTVVFGLVIAELSLKFADAIDSNAERPIGILGFLAWAIGINLAAGSDLVPGSQWGHEVGLSFHAPEQARNGGPS